MDKNKLITRYAVLLHNNGDMVYEVFRGQTFAVPLRSTSSCQCRIVMLVLSPVICSIDNCRTAPALVRPVVLRSS